MGEKDPKLEVPDAPLGNVTLVECQVSLGESTGTPLSAIASKS